VDHFDVVTRAGLADPVATWFTVDLSSGSLEDGLDSWPGGGATSGHERGAIASTFLATGDTRANEEEALGF